MLAGTAHWPSPWTLTARRCCLLRLGTRQLYNVLALKKSAGDDDLFACKDSSQVAGREKVNYAAEASQIPAGTLCAPMLFSQGST